MSIKKIIIAFCSLSLCATPGIATSNTDLNIPSLGAVSGLSLSLVDEQKLGQALMNRIRASKDYLNDLESRTYLNRLGYQLVEHTKTHSYSFFFFPIRDASLNAFALPGGFIAVHSGTIVAAQTESELSGVMAHEIGHVTQRHIARMIESQQGNLGLTIGSILLAILAARAGGSSGAQAASAITLGSQAAMIQSRLNFSRDAEREADRIGLTTLSKSGFDPRGMESFFERLHSNNRFYESAAPAYLSTHPLSRERMSDMENRTRSLPQKHHEDSLDFFLIKNRLMLLQATSQNDLINLKKSLRANANKFEGKARIGALYGLSVLSSQQQDWQEASHWIEEIKSQSKTSDIVNRQLQLIRFQSTNDKLKKHALNAAKAALELFPLSEISARTYIDLLYLSNQNKALIDYLKNNSIITDQNFQYHALMARSYEKLGQKAQTFLHTAQMYALQGAYEAAVYQLNQARKVKTPTFTCKVLSTPGSKNIK